MKLKLYKTATARHQRQIYGESGHLSICIDKRLLVHVLGFLDTLSPQFSSESSEVDEMINDVYESVLQQIPCSVYGAEFRLDQAQSRDLEEQQGVDVGLPAPWEFQQTDDGILQYRTKEE